MSAYPALDEYEECPKCGQDFSGDSNQPELKYGCKSTTTASGEYTILDEWIRRICPTCEFAWREAVK